MTRGVDARRSVLSKAHRDMVADTRDRVFAVVIHVALGSRGITEEVVTACTDQGVGTQGDARSLP